jgi:hypothetical protein
MKSVNFFIKKILSSIICGILLTNVQLNGQSKFSVFKSGEGGYKCFRIPAIITTTKGTILAVAIHPGPAAYSNMVQLPNGNLACLYEAGEKNPYENIVFQALSFSDFKQPK